MITQLNTLRKYSLKLLLTQKVMEAIDDKRMFVTVRRHGAENPQLVDLAQVVGLVDEIYIQDNQLFVRWTEIKGAPLYPLVKAAMQQLSMYPVGFGSLEKDAAGNEIIKDYTLLRFELDLEPQA